MKYILEPLEDSSIPNEDDIRYQIRTNNTYSNGHYEVVMHNDPYYNQALNKKLAKEWIKAANHFPEAIRLLKEYKKILESFDLYDIRQYDKLNEFLTKLEEDV